MIEVLFKGMANTDTDPDDSLPRGFVAFMIMGGTGVLFAPYWATIVGRLWEFRHNTAIRHANALFGGG